MRRGGSYFSSNTERLSQGSSSKYFVADGAVANKLMAGFELSEMQPN